MDQNNQTSAPPNEQPHSASTHFAKDSDSERIPNTTQPFDEIALALSGGGYRAAAFHLGTLDMLHRLELLQSVRVLSTVSGGTLTGLKYALSVTEGNTFEEFYHDFYSFLGTTNIIDRGLSGLKPSHTSPFFNQMPSLIRGVAQVYASPNMLGNKTFGLLLQDQTSHLREASFNATEFRTANYFRFQKSASPRARIGNGNLAIKRGVAEMIRLADIAAASSCFPSAFEPLRFPDDFLWPHGLEEVRQALGKNFTKTVPLMDGGIIDNQGVDSIIRAYERAKVPIGLLIISDTTQRNPSIFEFTPKKNRGFLTLSLLVKSAWLIFLISFATAIALIIAWRTSILSNGFRPVDLLIYLVPIILSSLFAGGLWWIRRQYKEGEKRVAEVTTVELWPFLKRLTVPQLIDLIDGRAKSLIALTASIFTARVRALVYRDINVHKKYEKRQFANIIYDLDELGPVPDHIVEELAPTKEFSDLAKLAESVGTNLWINRPDELRNLVACGQITTCFNVLRYILEYRQTELNTIGSREEEIYKKAHVLWDELKKNRYAFLR